MSDDYQTDGFSPMDDDRTVAMPPVGDEIGRAHV